MILCELDLTSTPFCDTKIITYEIELPPSGNKIGFNLLDDEYFTIPFVTKTIPNSPSGHQLPTQDKKNVWIVDTNGEEPITDQGVLSELNRHQNPRGNPRSRLVYVEGRATIGYILNRFAPYLINPYLWFHILKFVSHINLSPILFGVRGLYGRKNLIYETTGMD